MKTRSMKVSEVRAALDAIECEHGDLTVEGAAEGGAVTGVLLVLRPQPYVLITDDPLVGRCVHCGSTRTAMTCGVCYDEPGRAQSVSRTG